jgi:hypothetical protein
MEEGANKIGRITTAGVVTNEFPIPTPNGTNGLPQIITAGPGRALWFTECVSAVGSNQCTNSTIGRITTAGTITQFSIPVSPLVITRGRDGALWFAEEDGNNINRITTAGVLTQFPIPAPTGKTLDITTGPDGALWFTEQGVNNIGRLSVPVLRVTPATNIVASGPQGGPFSPTSFHYQLSSTSAAASVMPAKAVTGPVRAGVTRARGGVTGRVTGSAVVAVTAAPSATVMASPRRLMRPAFAHAFRRRLARCRCQPQRRPSSAVGSLVRPPG